MEWMCAECGALHQKNNPPCKECGAMQFEKTVVRRKPEDDNVDPANVEWECPECGRRHPKNNPPCSKCGNMQLDSVEVDHSTDEPVSAGFSTHDMLKAVGLITVVAVLIFGVLNTGVLNQSSPTVNNVPGEANESSGLDLRTVEYNIYENINEERSIEGIGTLSVKSKPTEMAKYYNKLMVKRGQYPLNKSSKDVFKSFSCHPTLAYNRIGYESATNERAIGYYSTEEELAREISRSWLSSSDTRPILLDEESSSMGVDVHVAPNGDVYVTVVLC